MICAHRTGVGMESGYFPVVDNADVSGVALKGVFDILRGTQRSEGPQVRHSK